MKTVHVVDPIEAPDESSSPQDLPPIEMPPRFLEWGFEEARSRRDSYKLLVSYSLASDAQKHSVFPKRHNDNNVLSADNFVGEPCYELWIDGELTGLCHAGISGALSGKMVILVAKLEAIYLKARMRRKGLLTPFLAITGHAMSQELLSHIMASAGAGADAFEVVVEADLYSFGGQTAVSILGEFISENLDRAKRCTGLDISTSVENNNW